MATMNFPEDFPARDKIQIGVMTISKDCETIHIDMWGEKVEVAGKTDWPTSGSDWSNMLKDNGLKMKKRKYQTDIVKA